ncbi:MAG TPA: acyltransferase, partial [Arthrobacter bacterium]|nr:acyltransferase [Arthrobacter sp.]
GAFGRLEERPTASVHTRGRPAAAVVTAAVVVFIPVADAAVNGLTLGLLGGGAACFALAVLLLGRMPERLPADVRAEPGQAGGQTGIGAGGPLPAGPSSANVEP